MRITIKNEITVGRAPADVYAYVTTPGNWKGTHPATVDVKGSTGGSARVGDQWIEVITQAGQPHFDQSWTAVAAEPGKLWTIEAPTTVYPGLSWLITYTFEDEGGKTLFTREMTTVYDPDNVPEEVITTIHNPLRHNAYLARVKNILEA
ncbi:SRPBCC family protein [Streptomyces tubercidicus]